MRRHLLAGLRVLDLGGAESDLVGRLFADLGADVLKIEPPAGSAARRELPSVAGTSIPFTLHNANKRSAVLDPDRADDRNRLVELAGTADIVVGAPIAGRTSAETEALIGFFINTLVLRSRVDPMRSVRDFIRDVHDTVLNAHAHQDLPFEKLVDELNPARDLGHTPLFQVAFVLQNAPRETLQMSELTLRNRASETRTAKFNWSVSLIEAGDEIVGRDPSIEKLHGLIVQVARTSTTVLITGESGTGKELVARAIHHQGPRRDSPFVAVNPAAIAETLIESELFGHEKGAFTGAHQRKLGKFELAQGGTLFLDEIATLRSELQVKLLRVLQEREIERVGGGQAIKLDVRIIAATNADVPAAVAAGTFREDLFYRLNVVHLAVPPLRERVDDIELLVAHFIRRYNHEFGKRIEGLTPEAREKARSIFEKWELDFAEVGRLTDSGHLVLKMGGKVVADMPVQPLVDKAPVYERPWTPTPPRRISGGSRAT